MSTPVNQVSALASSQVQSSGSNQTSSSTKKKTSGIDFESFLKIMAAQMQNQSLTSQTDDSQYITEMALFSAIQAMNTQTSEANKQYAASLVGSDVRAVAFDSSTNQKQEVVGTVSRAFFDPSSDAAGVQIGDKVYDLSAIMDVYGYRSTDSTTSMQYASSLVGKTVTVQTTDADTGVTAKVTGKVESATLDPSTGAITLSISGKSYSVSDVVQIFGEDVSSQGGDSGAQQA